MSFFSITYGQIPLINAHTDISNKTRSLTFCLRLYLYPYFEYPSSEDSGQSEQSLLNDAISTKILSTDPFVLLLCDRMVNCVDQDQTVHSVV